MNRLKTDTTDSGIAKKYIFIIIFAICFYWAAIYGIASISGMPPQQILVHLGVPALKSEFSDMSLVASWCDWSADGKNPFVEPRIDAAGRTLRMNYPPIFLSLRWIGISASNFYLYAVFLSLAFYLALAFFARPTCFRDLLVWIGIACSPAIVFAVERANFDLAVFVLLAMGTFFYARRFAVVACILSASLLKFYPLAGMIVAIDNCRRGWVSFSVGVALFAAYFYSIREFLPYIFNSLDGNVSCAFGAAVIPAAIGRPDLQLAFQFLFLCLGFFVGTIGVYLTRHQIGMGSRECFSGRLGLPIFIVLFLSGAQFDYKMIFLIFVVPTSLCLMRNPSALYQNIGKIWLIFYFIYTYWMFFSGEACLRNLILKQGVAILLFLLSCFICGALYREFLVAWFKWLQKVCSNYYRQLDARS
jgi:hypothetical protein